MISIRSICHFNEIAIILIDLYLQVYNKALLIYADARVKDALDYLDREVKQLSSIPKKNDIDNKLEAAYQSKPLKIVLKNGNILL